MTLGEIVSCQIGTGGLIIWQHYICSDGYSQGILIPQQLEQFYEAYKNGVEPAPPKKIYAFRDYLKTDKKYISFADLLDEGEYVVAVFGSLKKHFDREGIRRATRKLEASIEYMMHHMDSSVADCVAYIRTVE